jgi:hypothetical protein
LDLQFISSGVAARSLQDALIWLSGLTPKKTLELPTKDYQPLAHFHAGSALDCVKKKSLRDEKWRRAQGLRRAVYIKRSPEQTGISRFSANRPELAAICARILSLQSADS